MMMYFSDIMIVIMIYVSVLMHVSVRGEGMLHSSLKKTIMIEYDDNKKSIHLNN